MDKKSISMDFNLSVRGYELDSLGHVNGANYLKYAEAARWYFFKKKGYIALLKQLNLMPVLTECSIRYIHELKIFDKIVIKSNYSCNMDFIIAKHVFYFYNSHRKAAISNGKLLMIDRTERIVHSLPEEIKKDFLL